MSIQKASRLVSKTQTIENISSRKPNARKATQQIS